MFKLFRDDSLMINLNDEVKRLPRWFRQDLPDMKNIRQMKSSFEKRGVHTVCEFARCPNMGKCWSQRTATFMILGDVCTRACRFCAVKARQEGVSVDPHEARQVALTVAAMRLRYAVITSVTRDDLKDGGSEHFAQTIREIQACNPDTKIEVLIPDFGNELASLEKVVHAQPQVIGHNLETVKRLSPKVRPQAGYERSLAVLRALRRLDSEIIIKSSLMVGLGESSQEIYQAMRDLLDSGCDILTIGQYLAPTSSKRHLKVERFVSPKEFNEYQKQGQEMGFKHVLSSPLTRSSFIAQEAYEICMKKREKMITHE